MKVGVFTVIIVISLALMTAIKPSDESAIQTAQDAGYQNIQLTDNAYFACGSGDIHVGRNFTATMNNTQVRGTVCCGWFFKGCTIRH